MMDAGINAAPVTPQVTSPFKSLPENLNAEAGDSSSPQVTSDEYTPTTEWVQAGWMKARMPDGVSAGESFAEFDRWLTAHDAEILASRPSVEGEREATAVIATELEWFEAQNYDGLSRGEIRSILAPHLVRALQDAGFSITRKETK